MSEEFKKARDEAVNRILKDPYYISSDFNEFDSFKLGADWAYEWIFKNLPDNPHRGSTFREYELEQELEEAIKRNIKLLEEKAVQIKRIIDLKQKLATAVEAIQVALSESLDAKPPFRYAPKSDIKKYLRQALAKIKQTSSARLGTSEARDVKGETKQCQCHVK